MIQATKIQMHDGKSNSNSVQEIKSIYLVGVKQAGFYKKEKIYDFIKNNPSHPIEVAIAPNPKLIAVMSGAQKYVRSEPNDTPNDNLLKLPRS